ncbi:polysaccharide deacetylase family protein [Sporosarcina soli]|uniref:Polysaccharide deacetylase family protein n=1 Tax=Sporosarcina soli TaxID=334736 RepID=A0ABW0TI59_9BACL
MKNSLLAIFIAGLISLAFGIGKSEAAIMKTSHHVGLHDRLLDIEDVRVIDNDMKVPLDEIAKVLYIPVETEAGNTIIRKRGIEIVYNEATNLILQDGKELTWSPIVDIDGTIYISVKYIAREIGFKVEYFPKQKTLRIYRDDYEHMSHSDYEKHIANLLAKKEASKPAAKATVYLTFDDGPNKYTKINNNTLKEYNVQGTFFFLGNYMKNNEEIVQTVAEAGHYIGSHSMTHDQNKVYKSTKSFIDEMSGGIDLIHEITGIDSKLIRVPYGSKPHVTPAMQQELTALGYKMWDWNVDSNDWKYTDKQVDKIIENVQNGVQKAHRSGEQNIIILMHDRSQTTKALPEIIQWLQQEGYTIKPYEPDHHITQNFLNDITL